MAKLIKPSLKFKRSFISALKEGKGEKGMSRQNLIKLEKDFEKFLESM